MVPVNGAALGPTVPAPSCPPPASVPVTAPSPRPRCRRLSEVSPLLSVLRVLSDDRLWTERFLQLPGLARSRQQCGHQSDGWRLCLNHLTKAHRGAEGRSRVTCRVAPRVSPEGTTLAPV